MCVCESAFVSGDSGLIQDGLGVIWWISLWKTQDVVAIGRASRGANGVSAPKEPFRREKWLRNQLKNIELHKNVEKNRISSKKGLRVRAAIRKYPLTGGAEAHGGAPDGPHGNETQTTNQRH